MQHLIQLLISGLAIGAIYGLIAMGFAVIYKSTGLVNFAQGEMTIITAYIAWTISTTVSGNVFVVALCAILEKELDHDDGELTATQKVRRTMIEKKFARELAIIYQAEG